MKLKLYKIYIHKNVFKSYEIYNRSFNINFNKFLSILIVCDRSLYNSYMKYFIYLALCEIW